MMELGSKLKMKTANFHFYHMKILFSRISQISIESLFSIKGGRERSLLYARSAENIDRRDGRSLHQLFPAIDSTIRRPGLEKRAK